MNEESLIHQAQEGDIVAFNRLVVQHQEMVFNVAYRIMGDPAVAEDVAQETFITAYQSLKSFRGGSFKSWLIRVATNRCYDELRRRKRRPQTSLDEIMDENESFAFLRSPGEGPEAHRQRVELALVIERCLKVCPMTSASSPSWGMLRDMTIRRSPPSPACLWARLSRV